MLKKLLLGTIALLFVLFGSLILLLGYVFNNPSSILTAFNKVTHKLTEEQAYEEKEEYFLMGLEEVRIKTRQVQLKVRSYSGSTLQVQLEGQIPRFEQGPFILSTTDKSTLYLDIKEPIPSHWIQMNINGEELTTESNAELQATLYLPTSFKKLVSIETETGNIELKLPESQIYELNLQSISGTITNHLNQKPTPGVLPQDVGRIDIKTNQGSISVEPTD